MNEIKDPEVRPVIGADVWRAIGRDRFGPRFRDWRFRCPVCNTVQSGLDFQRHTEMDPHTLQTIVGFSCIGRWTKAMGCDYAGGGLFKLNPVRIRTPDGITTRFEFDDADD